MKTHDLLTLLIAIIGIAIGAAQLAKPSPGVTIQTGGNILIKAD